MKSNLILWLSTIWIPALMAWMLNNETQFKKNIVVGVTFPHAARSNEKIHDRLEKYKRENRFLALIFTIAAIPPMFIGNISISFTLWGIWLFLLLVLPLFFYARCNRDLKKIKKAENWYQIPTLEREYKELNLSETKFISPWFFVIPFILSLLPIIFKKDLYAIFLVNAAMILLSFLAYRYLYDKTAEKIDTNLELTKILTEIRRQNWGRAWIILSYCFLALNYIILFLYQNPIALFISTVVLCTVMCIAVIAVEVNTRKVQEKLSRNSGQSSYVDEDDKWIWGFIYYNPENPKLMVNDRVGMNVNFNVATTGGKFIFTIIIVLCLLIPFMGPIMAANNQPPSIEIKNETLIASSAYTSYKVTLEEIATIDLLDDLPENLQRVAGTGLPDLLKGNFTAPKYGKMKVCLNPKEAPYILIETNNGELHLFSGSTAEQTKNVFNQVKSRIKVAAIPNFCHLFNQI